MATIEQSDPRMENNPYLLLEAEVANTFAYLTADASKIDKDNASMKISMER